MIDTINLRQILRKGAFENGVPRINVIDAIYDEVYDVRSAATAHNLEMFFFVACDSDEPVEIELDDIAYAPEEFEEIGDYLVYALTSPNDTFQTAQPITDVSVQDDGRVLLFL